VSPAQAPEGAQPAPAAQAQGARHLICDEAALAALYGTPAANSIRKEVAALTPAYRAVIEASPFCTLATSGPGGLDVSPRGDPAGFVHVEDECTLMLPDRRGNNRVDSLRNVLADARVALLFMVPPVNETLRVNGRAVISVDPALCTRFAIDGKPARSVLVITIETVFLQCSRALLRSRLWQPDTWADRGALPTAGRMLQQASAARADGEPAVDGAAYDRALPARVAGSLY
jgi:PPOX class probable FMN-dependent enzyme